MKLDEKDHSIISILRTNSRLSVREIARKTKLRPSTVHQRMQRLTKGGIIEKYTLKLSNKAMGEDFIVFMLVRGETSDYLTPGVIADRHVKEVFGITGEHDVLMKLKFSGIDKFNDYVINFRKKVPGVISTMTMVATVVIKEEY